MSDHFCTNVSAHQRMRLVCLRIYQLKILRFQTFAIDMLMVSYSISCQWHGCELVLKRSGPVTGWRSGDKSPLKFFRPPPWKNVLDIV